MTAQATCLKQISGYDTPLLNHLMWVLVALGQAQIPRCGISDFLQFISNRLCKVCSLSSPMCAPLGLLSVSTCSVASRLCMSVPSRTVGCPLLASHCRIGGFYKYKLCDCHSFCVALCGTLPRP